MLRAPVRVKQHGCYHRAPAALTCLLAAALALGCQVDTRRARTASTQGGAVDSQLTAVWSPVEAPGLGSEPLVASNSARGLIAVSRDANALSQYRTTPPQASSSHVLVYESQSPRVIGSIPVSIPLALAWSPSGDRLAVAESGTVIVWDVQTRKVIGMHSSDLPEDVRPTRNQTGVVSTTVTSIEGLAFVREDRLTWAERFGDSFVRRWDWNAESGVSASDIISPEVRFLSVDSGDMLITTAPVVRDNPLRLVTTSDLLDWRTSSTLLQHAERNKQVLRAAAADREGEYFSARISSTNEGALPFYGYFKPVVVTWDRDSGRPIQMFRASTGQGPESNIAPIGIARRDDGSAALVISEQLSRYGEPSRARVWIQELPSGQEVLLGEVDGLPCRAWAEAQRLLVVTNDHQIRWQDRVQVQTNTLRLYAHPW